MSHGKIRKEYDCLNCGVTVQGKYCQDCGQKNIEPKETLWSMVVHFFTDITHFDGKFFKTLGILFTQPGLLSLEYVKGRRVKYLNPIRMYVFTSWIFFSFLLLTVTLPDYSNTFSEADTENLVDIALAKAKNATDSAAIRQAFGSIGVKDSIQTSGERLKVPVMEGRQTNVSISVPNDSTSMGWGKKLLQPLEGKANNTGFWTKVIEKFIHSFPYLLFVSLPLYAFFLYLLYWRQRHRFYYADHGLFLIHLYIFTFVWMLVYIGLSKIPEFDSWPFDVFIGWTMFGMFVYGVYYAYKSMRVFYGQGRAKTLLKFVAFNGMCFAGIMLLFFIFFGISIYRAIDT